ncbi:MAG: DEAD/DEAH box helicase, partial [Bradymonadaceae bacterium]
MSREVRNSLEDYLRTTFGLVDEEAERSLFEFLKGDRGMFRGPYVEVSRPYQRAGAEEATGDLSVTPDFTPYRHQAEAWRRLSSVDRQPRDTLVSTGTGSGKTEAFIYPILDHCWRHRDEEGVKALILYPMNALAGDQARRIAGILWDDERLRGEVSAGLYIGDDGGHATSGEEHLCDQRGALREEPPDVLLTNYRMLDFLLMRPRDRKVWRHNGPETLQYLVLDELHTYDGAQATDVACLLRRLAARLEAPEDHICGIGTSATMGAGSAAARAELRRFAGDVFGGEFEDGAIVTSTRVDALEVEWGGSRLSAPPPWQRDDWDPEVLDPDRYADVGAYIERQASLWFGLEGADPVRIGRLLAASESVRKLTAAACDGPTSIEEICRVFREGDANGHRGGTARATGTDLAFGALAEETQRLAIRSLLALISFAERPDGNPLMQVRVESWTRELRRLVGRVPGEGETPEFDWEDRAGDREGLWLPGVYCRDCGEFGFAVTVAEESGSGMDLETDPRAIGRAWLNQSRDAAMLRPGSDDDRLDLDYVCPACPKIAHGPECEICGTETLPARMWTADDASDSSSKRFTGRCPSCDADDALTILASRAATLTSVAVSQIFQSSFNEDRKLLAFTDSVQDASHRAGFLGGRTFRFTMRRAIQGALEASDREGVSLEELGDAIWSYWEGEAESAAQLAGTLMPPDLEWIESWQSFVDALPDEDDEEIPAPPDRLVEDLRERLSWETTMEYGLRSRVGRTLELTGCSTAAPDREAMREAADALTLELTEEEPVPGAANLEIGEVEVFLAGLLERLRTRGGIHHPMLRGFVGAGGERFMLSRKKQPLMSPFGPHSVLPRFLDEHHDPPTFDAVFSGPDKATWYRDWAERSMRLDPGLRGINDVYRAAIRHLADAGLLRSTSVERSGKSRDVWGLAPEALRVYADVETMT